MHRLLHSPSTGMRAGTRILLDLHVLKASITILAQMTRRYVHYTRFRTLSHLAACLSPHREPPALPRAPPLHRILLSDSWYRNRRGVFDFTFPGLVADVFPSSTRPDLVLNAALCGSPSSVRMSLSAIRYGGASMIMQLGNRSMFSLAVYHASQPDLRLVLTFPTFLTV
ncbi:hypothetical protein EDB84DRAFT_1568214 [Lactarius hengduanensis]|nr:hypothetical protein EDB84DRAFT_1568214 [Lactarius hengduanensis]